jgi:hypothetical protein
VNLGRKQSKETIEKRVYAINQEKREERRQKTMLERYGSLMFANDPVDRGKRISESLTGRERSAEHASNIINSKRINGTLKHKESTKEKIRSSLLTFYAANPDREVYFSSGSRGRGHESGKIEGFSYRSSYELYFIKFCLENKINIESAENSKRRIRYDFEGRSHWYYPDFYLVDFDLLVEIKPSKFKNDERVISKIQATIGGGKLILLLTEKELFHDEVLMKIMEAPVEYSIS